MNSQDITRALIDTTVARAMVEMDADPKRSVRKLCDLGRQFSRGRFQNQIFAIFQDLLRNDESPYYQAIDFLLRSNDPEALRQFGINIGYNSFTYGAQILRQKQKELSFAVPWVVKLRLDSRIPDTYDSSFFASVVRTGLTYGIYSYQLRSMDHHEDMESYLAVIQSHPECAFLWFLSDTPLTEKQQKLLLSCPNLMVSLPIDAPSTASMAKALRRQKTLFGMHKVYQDADAAAYLLSFDHLYSQMEQSVFFFLVADDSCSKESIRAVSDVVQQYRFTPIQPFFPIEVQEDSRKIEQIITAHPAYLLLLPDHMARTLEKEILYKKRHDRLEHLVKVILKTVLPFDPQGTLVKCFILIENIADRHQHIPFILKVLSAHVCQKVHIKDPVYQIVFIFKMIIKAFPVQTAFLAEI